MNTEIQRADPRLRRITIIVVCVAAAAGMLAVHVFRRWLLQATMGLTQAQLIARMHLWSALSMTGIGLCLLLLAGYCARLGRRTIEQQRWPPEPMRVLHDTPVRRGARAVAYGRLLNVIAAVLMLLAVFAGLMSWRMFTPGH